MYLMATQTSMTHFQNYPQLKGWIIALASMVEFARRRTNKEKKKAMNPQSLFETVRHYFDPEQERFIVVGTNGAILPISLIQSVSNSSGNLLTIF